MYDETGSDKLGPLGLWNSFHVGVKNLFQLYAQASDVAASGGPPAGDLLDFTEKIADIVCRKEAYAKITKKIDSAISNVNPQKISTNRVCPSTNNSGYDARRRRNSLAACS